MLSSSKKPSKTSPTKVSAARRQSDALAKAGDFTVLVERVVVTLKVSDPAARTFYETEAA